MAKKNSLLLQKGSQRYFKGNEHLDQFIQSVTVGHLRTKLKNIVCNQTNRNQVEYRGP